MTMPEQRTVVWFSCGAASAVAAKYALQEHTNTHVVYCDTSQNEHPDNLRFITDVESWLGVKIERISSDKFSTIEDVFEARKYMSGIAGAPCTVELKKVPRFKYQLPDDMHVFGYTAEESKRIKSFIENNPELYVDFILQRLGITKQDCYRELLDAKIQLPAMYLAGFHNNNCLGCVKATSPKYWNKIRHFAPKVFQDRAEQSRRLGVKLTRVKGKRIYLDELPDQDYGRYKDEDIPCGPECGVQQSLFKSKL